MYFLAISGLLCSHQSSPQLIIKGTTVRHQVIISASVMFLETYFEPLYLLSRKTPFLSSPRLKLCQYTLTQFNILLWTFKVILLSHFSLKLFKVLLFADNKCTNIAVVTLLFQTNNPGVPNSRDIKPKERLREMGR